MLAQSWKLLIIKIANNIYYCGHLCKKIDIEPQKFCVNK